MILIIKRASFVTVYFILMFTFVPLWAANPSSYSLENYLLKVVEKNQDLQVRSYSVQQAKAMSDNQLKSNPINTSIKFDNNHSNRLSTDILDSVNTVENVSNDVSASLSKTLITGSEVGVSTGYSFSEGNSKKLPQDLRSYHNTYLNVSLSQPLLSGVSNIYKRRDWELSKKEEQVRALDFKEEVNQIIFKAIHAYFQLLESQKKIGLEKKSLEVTRQSLSTMNVLVEKGLESQVKLLEIQSEVLNKENKLYKAESDYYEKRIQFLNLIDEPEKDLEIQLVSDPLSPYSVSDKVDLEQVWNEALLHRVDYQKEKNQESKVQLQLAIKKSSTLPKLNVNSKYYVYGTDSEFSETFSRAASQDYNSWSVGLEFNMAVDGYFRSNQLAPLYISLKESRHRKNALERKIKQELYSQMTILELNYRQYQSAQKSFKIAEENFNRTVKLREGNYIKEEEFLQSQKNRDMAFYNIIQSQVQFTLSYYTFLQKRGVLLSELGIHPEV